MLREQEQANGCGNHSEQPQVAAHVTAQPEEQEQDAFVNLEQEQGDDFAFDQDDETADDSENGKRKLTQKKKKPKAAATAVATTPSGRPVRAAAQSNTAVQMVKRARVDNDDEKDADGDATFPASSRAKTSGKDQELLDLERALQESMQEQEEQNRSRPTFPITSSSTASLAVRFCGSCGTRRTNHDAYCGNCGKQITF
jgi:hypothetical protein